MSVSFRSLRMRVAREWTWGPIPLSPASRRRHTHCRLSPTHFQRTSPMRSETKSSSAAAAQVPASPPRNGGRAALDLDTFMPYRLSVLSNRVSKAIAGEYSSRFGLTIPEWRVMAVLGGTPGLSARAVAERTEMDKVQVSRAVARLLRAKRIERSADGDDGRVTRLALSSRGKTIYDEIAPL